LLESGHHGDLWLDLDGLFTRPTRVARFATELATRIAAHEPEAVCGPLVGGAFLAEMIASCLDVEFFYSERAARPGGGLYAVDYRLPPLFEARFAVSALRSSTMWSTPPRRRERPSRISGHAVPERSPSGRC
jgi:orotate phosphoribosyltransferase